MHRDCRKRIYKTSGGRVFRLTIERMQCPKCRRLHSILPDFLVPFKHYGANIIEGVLDRPTSQEYDLANDDPTEDYPCESTKQRWLKWLESNRINIDSIIKLVYYRAHALNIPCHIEPSVL